MRRVTKSQCNQAHNLYMQTLEEQLRTIPALTPHQVVMEICKRLNIEERGGGPESIYYTHALVEGECSYRNLPWFIGRVQFELNCQL